MSNVRTGALGQLAAYGDVARHVGRGKLARLAADLFNRVLALLLLLLFSPLLVWVAVRIWQVDGAPILFAHYRVGRDGRLFGCLKFRTMVRDSRERLAQLLASDPKARADWERDQKLDHDPRITPIGHRSRRISAAGASGTWSKAMILLEEIRLGACRVARKPRRTISAAMTPEGTLEKPETPLTRSPSTT